MMSTLIKLELSEINISETLAANDQEWHTEPNQTTNWAVYVDEQIKRIAFLQPQAC